MQDCTCGGPVEDGDPNGPICTNTGRYVSSCVGVEIRAEINVASLLDDFIDETDLIDVSQEAAECDTY